MNNIEKLIDLVMLGGDKHDQAAIRAAHGVGGVLVGFDHRDVSELKREGPPALQLRSFHSLDGIRHSPRPVFMSHRLTMHLLNMQARTDNLLAHWLIDEDTLARQRQLIKSQEHEMHGMQRESQYHRMRLNLLLSVPGVLEVPGVNELLEKWGMGPEDNIAEDNS